jgi:hypothetical protein
MALDHSCQVQRHQLSERGADLYETPPEAVRALLRVEGNRVPHNLWEPGAGRGAIVRVLRDAGHAVIASDLVDYGFPLHFVADFLKMTTAPVGVEAILTNPPFKAAAAFVARALELCPRVFMLMRLAFYEAGELNNKRLDRHLRALVLDSGTLARIHAFRLRLPMMHRDRWAGKKANSGMAFAWFCWDADHNGPTTINRISWKLSAAGEPEKSPIVTTEAIMAPRNIKAVEQTKKTEAPAAEENGTPLAIAKPSGGFDLNKFKSKRAAAVANIETLPTSLPVHNMAAAKDHIRMHSDETNYWSDELCFVKVPIKGQKRDTLHLIDEDLAMQFLESGEILRCRLALAAKPYDVFFLCEVPTQNLDNDWNKSNLEGCEKAKTQWTKQTSRKGEGVEAYKNTAARDPGAFPEPNWPTQSLGELIERAFVGRIIETENHPALLRKIGAKQPLA